MQQFDYAYGEINPADGTVDPLKNTGQLARIETFAGGTVATPIKQNQQRFAYDSLGRLRQSSEYRGDNTAMQTYQQTFSYDRFSNRYMKQAENQNPALPYSPVEDTEIDKNTNRLTPATNTSYDNTGNTIVDGKFRGATYSYDANGRMVKAVRSSDGLTSNFVQDAVGNRIGSKVNNAWQFFVYDINGRLIAEYGQPSGEQNKLKYVHIDWRGSTRAMTNSNGWAISRQDFTAFGDEISAGVGQGRTLQQNYTAGNIKQNYAQMEKDGSTGLNHTPWRKQDSSAGRWTSPDPHNGSIIITDPQSFNRYSYVGNDPINKIDPSGLFFVGVTTQVNSGLNVNNDYDWGWEDPDITLPPETVTVTDEEDPLIEHEQAIADALERANTVNVNEGETASNEDGDKGQIKISFGIKKCKDGDSLLTINGNAIQKTDSGGASIKLHKNADFFFVLYASKEAERTISVAPDTTIAVNLLGDKGNKGYEVNVSSAVSIGFFGPNVNVSNVQFNTEGQVTSVDATYLGFKNPVSNIAKNQVNNALSTTFGQGKGLQADVVKNLLDTVNGNKKPICITATIEVEEKK